MILSNNFLPSLDFTCGEVQPQALNLAQTRARSASPDFYLGFLCNYRVKTRALVSKLALAGRGSGETE